MTAFAGNGAAAVTGSEGDGGPATDASLAGPTGLAVDAAGDVLIADPEVGRVRRVDAGTGTITTVAGGGGGDDGSLATNASLGQPTGVAVDGRGDLFIADRTGRRVRRVAAENGIITTVAGAPVCASLSYQPEGRGPVGTETCLDRPTAVAVDGLGNLYFADGDRVRYLDRVSGLVSIVAGTGMHADGGDGGPATSAALSGPRGLAVGPDHALYVADTGNHRLRRVSTRPRVNADLSVEIACPAGACTVTVRNLGPDAVSGANVVVSVNIGYALGAWSCTASSGSRCAASGPSGGLVDVSDLASGGSATYSAAVTTDASPDTREYPTLMTKATVVAPPWVHDPVTSNNTATDERPDPFPPGYSFLLSPNGGETWPPGSVRTISWNPAGLSAGGCSGGDWLNLDLSDGNWTEEIAYGLNPRQGAFAWTVPYRPSPRLRVRVEHVQSCGEAQHLLEDWSDGTFAIAAAPRPVQLLTPNGGQSWPAASQQLVSWSSAGIDVSACGADPVTLLLSDGDSTELLAEVPAAQTEYLWTVPNWPGSRWRVAVVFSAKCGAMPVRFSDWSDGDFTITGPAPPPPPPAIDFNGDGRPDLLWHHQVTGELYTWLMSGTVAAAGSYLDPRLFTDTRWQIRGLGDFNGDGWSDVLWHNSVTGDLYVWFMNGTVVTGASYLSPSRLGDTRWQIEAVADFDGDGKPDLLWRHRDTGALYVWLMDGTAITGASYLTPAAADPSWHVRGVADLNQDGRADILWHNQTTGELYVWAMHGTVADWSTYLTPSRFADTHWQIRRVDDFDGDGQPDILWHHEITGDLYVWFLRGLKVTGGGYLTPSRFADTKWQIVPR